MSNNGLPIDFFSFNKYHHLTPLPLQNSFFPSYIYIFHIYKHIWSPPACVWRKELRSPLQRKWKNFQKHFSWPTRPWTKPAVNWSRFHFLITFSWGTMATPLPSPGHSRHQHSFPDEWPLYHGPTVSKEVLDAWLIWQIWPRSAVVYHI